MGGGIVNALFANKDEWLPGLTLEGMDPSSQTKKPLISLTPLTAAAELLFFSIVA